MTRCPTRDSIFVFGSNLAGIHGAGSALHAKQFYGAKQGQGYGKQGDSFAIPTKDQSLKRLSLSEIKLGVYGFLAYAQAHPELKFTVVAIGCGLAGYKPSDIAPLFKDASPNVLLPAEFLAILNEKELDTNSLFD